MDNIENKLVDNQHYLLGKPSVTGHYKQQFEDFVVKEDLGFELSGEGEHVFVYLRKRDCNTTFVAEQLAKYVGISAKLVSYAGLKDRHAVTEQWFGLHLPGKETPDFSNFLLQGCQILDVKRHNKKLRTGALKGNYFSLILRDISNQSELENRLTQVVIHGVPNYFGEQRFGRDNNNIEQAIKWAQGETVIKDRKKRSFYLSAARSLIFNSIVSTRIEQKLMDKVLIGDVLQLSGRGSWFVAEEAELPSLQQRVKDGELNITAPLLGDKLESQSVALTFENRCLSKWEDLKSLIQKERMETMRRSIILRPEQLTWLWQNDTTVQLDFYLPAGCYATAVLRELIIE